MGRIRRDYGCGDDGRLQAGGAEAQRQRAHRRIQPPLRVPRAWFRLQQCRSSAVVGVDPAQVTTAGCKRDGGGSVRCSATTRTVSTFAAVSLSSGIHGGAAAGTYTTCHRRCPL
ncbi:hypothetical protein OsJ_14454 [Oryza sativa Japonica Group]|nr:hypothetical protein OsJ_14454 [Oryza sativa Japonica Group]